jgi:hypothetical protein
MKTRMMIWLEEEEKLQLQAIAKMEDRSLTSLVRRAVVNVLASYPGVHDPPRPKTRKPAHQDQAA